MGFFTRKKRQKETISLFLLNDGYELHNRNSQNTTFVKNLNVVQIVGGKEEQRVVFDIGGEVLFDVRFPPTLTLLKFLIKNAESYYKKHIE